MNNLAGVLRAIHNALCVVRTTAFERGAFDNSHFYWAAYGRARGLIEGARAGGFISHEAEVALGDLVSNASSNAGKPFPDPRNVGPVMPILVWAHRNAVLGKPQAPVAARESDQQVSAPAAPRRLPMQRVLVSPFYVLRTLFGEPITRSIRPTFARLHPSWAPVSAGWPMAVPGSQMRLPLGPT